jgi:DNA repair exonuclease SbcCD ATPase subunit
VAPAVAVAEPQAAHDPLRRQTADRQASELEQQNLQRSHGVEQISRAPDAGRQKAAQQPVTAASPTGSASAELQAKRDALQRQIADLQRQSGELNQQVQQRTHDLDQSTHEREAARSETNKLRQDIAALEQFRKTAEHQIADSTRPLTNPLGPSAAAGAEQQATQDELRRQNADLQQQVTQRSHDLDTACPSPNGTNYERLYLVREPKMAMESGQQLYGLPPSGFAGVPAVCRRRLQRTGECRPRGPPHCLRQPESHRAVQRPAE